MYTLRPLFVTSCRLSHPRQIITSNISKRTFLGTSKPQTLNATRTVPYPANAVYAVVSDVASYSKFLPFCRSSDVTATSTPDAQHSKTWPEEASLTIGYNDNMISEKFVSRVYCVPERIVEAVSGSAVTTLDLEDIAHHSPRADGDRAAQETVLTSLITRWTLRSFPYKPPPGTQGSEGQRDKTDLEAREQTEVGLEIEYAFANPLYAALSAAAAPKVANYVMEAFEKRVKSVVEGEGYGRGVGGAPIEGQK